MHEVWTTEQAGHCEIWGLDRRAKLPGFPLHWNEQYRLFLCRHWDADEGGEGMVLEHRQVALEECGKIAIHFSITRLPPLLTRLS